MIAHIALVGNPNSGKSTIFNLLTGIHQKTGNYPGVTVEKKQGYYSFEGSKVKVTDLPGTYSIYPKSEDEAIVSEFLNRADSKDFPDLFVVVADASNLERNLLLFTQLYDRKLPILLVLNMIDVAERMGVQINGEKLSSLLAGVSVIPLNARKTDSRLLKQSIAAFRPTKAWQPFYSNGQATNDAASLLNETEIRYEKIKKLLKFSRQENTVKKQNLDDRLDAVLTHKVWGYVVFIGILFGIFQAIYKYAQIPMDLIDSFFSEVGSRVIRTFPAGPLNDLVAEGLIPGIGGVVIFIPQITILFLFLAILEETGYMTRVVFIMDRLMRPFGLHGKSVVPLIAGVACAIPAIMSTRSISQPKERLITILVTPLMSCSARLPVYILIIGLTVPDKIVWGFIGLQGLALFLMYLLGFVAAIVFGFLFKLILKSKSKSFLIMEMPTYRLPQMKNVCLVVFDKVKAFVFDAGKIIVSIAIILWVLGSYGSDSRLIREGNHAEVTQVPLEKSFMGIIGKGIEPAIEPLGYDWKIGIALITSFAAREVFVGTMTTIYSLDEDMERQLSDRMRSEIHNKTGERRYNLATGFSLMIFYAFAMQCMSTLAITKRETNSWKWPLVQMTYMTVLAYFAALVVYQLLK